MFKQAPQTVSVRSLLKTRYSRYTCKDYQAHDSLHDVQIQTNSAAIPIYLCLSRSLVHALYGCHCVLVLFDEFLEAGSRRHHVLFLSAMLGGDTMKNNARCVVLCRHVLVLNSVLIHRFGPSLD
jgi:hypothetical protein